MSANPRIPYIHRRSLMVATTSMLLMGTLLTACSPEPLSFKNTDITGASFAQGLSLTDHTGGLRTLADFQGKVVVVFFGFTQCPDVCPSSMLTMAEVKRLLGPQGERLQVLFITVDPERDTLPLLKEYMANFDPTFLAMRPQPSELKAVAESFKVHFEKVEGTTPTSYTMDHSAGKYIFDTKGAVRLFSAYGTEASVIAEDIDKLLRTVGV